MIYVTVMLYRYENDFSVWSSFTFLLDMCCVTKLFLWRHNTHSIYSRVGHHNRPKYGYDQNLIQ